MKNRRGASLCAPLLPKDAFRRNAGYWDGRSFLPSDTSLTGLYCLDLLCETEYISIKEFESINADAVEIIKLITTSIRTAKLAINH
jgi:hypothetical protein